MLVDTVRGTSRWYAIYTHHKQETRVEENLKTGNVETFLPKLKGCRLNQFTGVLTYSPKPMFSRYLFARFKVSEMYHKITYTRGVHSVVSFGGVPTPVEDEIIDLLKARVGPDGFVNLDDELRPGERVMVRGGAFDNMVGIFDRRIKNTERAIILLTAISYQGRISVENDHVTRLG